MKHLTALLCLSLVIFSSCRKDRVCKCTVSAIGITSTRAVSPAAGIDSTFIVPLNNTTQNEITYKKVSKRRAKNNCVQKEEDFSDKTSNGIPGVFSLDITNSGTRDYDCKLE